MTVKVGNVHSELRPVNAGAPQGSVLGTYMFNVGTDSLEDGASPPTQERVYQIQQGDLSFLELAPITATSHSTPERNPPNIAYDISPITSNQDPISYVILPTARNVPTTLANRIEPT